MRDKAVNEKIYYTFLSIIACISLYWLLMLDFHVKSGIAGVCVWLVIFAAVNTARDILRNRFITVTVGIYAASAVVYRGVVSHNVFNVALTASMFIIYMAAYGTIKKRTVRIVSGYIELVLLVVSDFFNNNIPRLLICGVVVLFLISVSETLGFLGVNRCKGRSLAGLYVIIAAVLMITPVKSEPYDWHFFYKCMEGIKNVAADISDRFDLIFNGNNGLYKFNYTGYSEGTDTAGGGVNDSAKLQLTVTGERTAGALYLRGNICSEYDGRNWVSEEDTVTINYDYDAWMSIYACFYLNEEPEDIREYIEVKQQYINYENIRTKSVFMPLKTLGIKLSDEKKKMLSRGDNLRWKNIQKKQTGYHYIYMELDYSNEKLQDIIERASEVKYDQATWTTMLKYMREHYGVKPGFSFNDFKAAVKDAYSKVAAEYMQVSDSLSDEARSLEKKTVQGSGSELDTCIRLNNLTSSYMYNKRVRIPKDANVINYFLFDAKEGYCVHYATVLTQMLRNEGIPARFVEGFNVEYSQEDGIDGYPVKGNDAHAWVEAYIKGFGWIRLDAVKAFPRRTGNAGNAVSNPDYIMEEDDEEDDMTPQGSMPVTVVDKEAENEDDVQQPDISEDKQIYEAVIFLAGAVILIGVILIVMLLRRRKQLKNTRNPDIIIADILRILGKKYGKIQNGETVREYFGKIRCIASPEIFNRYRNVLEIIEAYEYGGGIIDEDGVDILRSFREGIA